MKIRQDNSDAFKLMVTVSNLNINEKEKEELLNAIHYKNTNSKVHSVLNYIR